MLNIVECTIAGLVDEEAKFYPLSSGSEMAILFIATFELNAYAAAQSQFPSAQQYFKRRYSVSIFRDDLKTIARKAQPNMTVMARGTLKHRKISTSVQNDGGAPEEEKWELGILITGKNAFLMLGEKELPPTTPSPGYVHPQFAPKKSENNEEEKDPLPF
jgi:hypothetical protein